MTKLAPNKKVYYISDSHFGVPTREKSSEREKLFIQWLDEVKADAQEIYIMGDLFEFWFEYKTVIPKGYARLLGKLAEITDSGIPVYFFRGNHDVWTFNYLTEELNIKIYPDTLLKEINGKKFFLGHGDGLGKGDSGYKFIKKVFRNKVNQWLFRWLHPDIGTAMGMFWSNRSRVANENTGIEKVNIAGIERLTGYCLEVLEKEPDIDYFIFGHIHKPEVVDLNGKAKYYSIGDWIKYFSYAVFDGEKIVLKFYK
ncbi:MAG: UDP-2,3-diacylglucosamine diphosphatase [Bacteroidetes bacterium]|nr:UDP-2,3-diacylglucosamine diphosphatase [Bacteroidota bacterium]MBL7102935.1 UDP-2,3-diacylglucosamine diphosphatase [Bacteroidales bacterium]